MNKQLAAVVWLQLATQGTGEESRNKRTQCRYGTAFRCVAGMGSKMSAQTAGGGRGGVPDIDKASSLSSFHKSVRRPISLPGLI